MGRHRRPRRPATTNLLVTTFGHPTSDATEALRLEQRPRITDLDDESRCSSCTAMSERGAIACRAPHLGIRTFRRHRPLRRLCRVLQRCDPAHQRKESKLVHATPIEVLHHIVDSIADGYFPRLAKLDDEIDTIEEEIFDTPTDEQLQRLFSDET